MRRTGLGWSTALATALATVAAASALAEAPAGSSTPAGAAELRRAGAVAKAEIAADPSADKPEFTPAITDVTVFKDGHALILARGRVKLADGWCRTREVPAPVLGTFWAFASDKESAVDYVRAGHAQVKDSRPCLTMEEIIQANAGRPAMILEQVPGAPPVTHGGTILGILENESKDEITAPVQSAGRYDRYGNPLPPALETAEQSAKSLASFVMLKEEKSVRMIKRENIVSLTVDEPKTATPTTRSVREISFHVSDLQGRPISDERGVGVVYLQKGIRWIPEYLVELLDDDKARVTLQGTVLNEIADLDNVNMRLVVGVPSFIMKDTLSPLALREAAPKLSSYFAPPSAPGRGGPQLDNTWLSNAMVSQAVGPSFAATGPSGPAVPMEGQNEDLYLYQRKGFTLKKGERSAIKLLEVTVPCEDVYKYEVPPLPPQGIWQNVNPDQVRQLAAALSAAKVMHVLRLTNAGDAPWTTGPASIFKAGVPLAQQVLTYTSVKNKADLPVTVATDLNPQREENEVNRQPNSITIDHNNYSKVTMHGKLTIASFKDKPARIIATRKVFGAITAVTADGKISATNLYEESPFAGDEYAAYPWPLWSFAAVNPISSAAWEATVPPGKSVTFEYDWYYYQRP